jgi:hypothetical protein
MAVVWADRPLNTIAATDVEALRRECATNARPRRNARVAGTRGSM